MGGGYSRVVAKQAPDFSLGIDRYFKRSRERRKLTVVHQNPSIEPPVSLVYLTQDKKKAPNLNSHEDFHIPHVHYSRLQDLCQR